MTLFQKILLRKEISDEPPVLVDIGASGGIHPDWKDIAKHSICIAFDPDEREMGYANKLSISFKKLHIIPSIVTVRDDKESPFYLTKSPYCSSLLEPDHNALNNWAFSDLFKVEKVANLKTVTLPQVLNDLQISKIDWFKTDSQGTDLRLFSSLSENIIDRMLAADFEPGIIDAYRGEDKLFSLMAFMENRQFWMSDLSIHGSQRIKREVVDSKLGRMAGNFIRHIVKTSPGWGEVSYINAMSGMRNFSKRDYLLVWVFSFIKKQHGFAYEVATKGLSRFDDPVFLEMQKHSLSMIKYSLYKVPLFFMKKVIDKIFKMAGVITR